MQIKPEARRSALFVNIHVFALLILPLVSAVSYNKNQMILIWEKFTVDDSIYFPKFRIDSFSAENSCGDMEERRSCIRGILQLSRKVSFYVTRFYAPTFLITFATFASYWMPAEEIAPRVVINMTPFLTLVTLHNALNNEINVSYVVALHIWMFACMFYTFMGLVVLFFAMQLNASEMRRQAMEERKRAEEEENNLLRKISRCVSDPVFDRQSQTMDKQIENPDGRRRSSFVQVPVEWLKQVSKSSGSSPIGIRLKQAVHWIRQQSKRLLTQHQKAGNEYVNAADRVARIVAPTTFAAFAISYFAFFYNYSEEHATHSSWS